MDRPVEPEMRTTVEMEPSRTPVRAVMSPGVIAVSAETTVSACAATMHARQTHAVLIVDEGTRQPAGWVFHLDVLGYLREDPLTTRAADVVSEEASTSIPRTPSRRRRNGWSPRASRTCSSATARR